jgi:nucleolar MIF4G domain-containing protein 1
MLEAEEKKILQLEAKLGLIKGKRLVSQCRHNADTGEHGRYHVPSTRHLAEEVTDYVAWLDAKRNAGGGVLNHHPIDNDIQSMKGVFSSDPSYQEQSQQVGSSDHQNSTHSALKSLNSQEGSTHAEIDDGSANLLRHLRGQINRLSDGNLLTIVRYIDEISQVHARGILTSTIVSIVLGQVQQPDNLTDSFFILHAAFVAAIYKIFGTNFGSQLVSETMRCVRMGLCKDFDSSGATTSVGPKQLSNLVAFVALFYCFGVINSTLILECLNLLLLDISESHIEIIWRIFRLIGRQLYVERPGDVDGIVREMNRAICVSEPTKSPLTRVRHMIDSINTLRLNKLNHSSPEGQLVSEHIRRMKQRLGEFSAQTSKRLDGTTAMGITLSDIDNAGLRGRWWLVGASVSDLHPSANHEDVVVDHQSSLLRHLREDEDIFFPDYENQARQQGLSSKIQSSIFTILMTAENAETAYGRFMALKLRPKDRRQVSSVLVHCVAREATYNHYYAIVAQQACQDAKIRFALQDTLWCLFRQMGEALFEDDNRRGEDAPLGTFNIEPHALKNIGTFYGSLIFNSSLTISLLKPLQLPITSTTTSKLVDHILMTIFRECVRMDENASHAALETIFKPAKRPSPLAPFMSNILSSLSGRPALKRMPNSNSIIAVITLAQVYIAL